VIVGYLGNFIHDETGAGKEIVGRIKLSLIATDYDIAD
jgi:hypothetical protein